MYDKLVAKVNGIDTNGFVLKTKYDTEKTGLENKIIIAKPLPSEFVLYANYKIKKENY